jgi:hypothetical protein
LPPVILLLRSFLGWIRSYNWRNCRFGWRFSHWTGKSWGRGYSCYVLRQGSW